MGWSWSLKVTLRLVWEYAWSMSWYAEAPDRPCGKWRGMRSRNQKSLDRDPAEPHYSNFAGGAVSQSYWHRGNAKIADTWPYAASVGFFPRIPVNINASLKTRNICNSSIIITRMSVSIKIILLYFDTRACVASAISCSSRMRNTASLHAHLAWDNSGACCNWQIKVNFQRVGIMPVHCDGKVAIHDLIPDPFDIGASRVSQTSTVMLWRSVRIIS